MEKRTLKGATHSRHDLNPFRSCQMASPVRRRVAPEEGESAPAPAPAVIVRGSRVPDKYAAAPSPAPGGAGAIANDSDDQVERMSQNDPGGGMPSLANGAAKSVLQKQTTLARMKTGRLLKPLAASLEFRMQAAKISTQLKQRDLDRVWTIDPRDSRILAIWDGISTLALICAHGRQSRTHSLGLCTAKTRLDAALAAFGCRLRRHGATYPV